MRLPGETLAAGASTGIIDLAIVTINLFDLSLAYPSFVNIVLPAIDQAGATLGESPAAITVFLAAPEPLASLLSLLPLGVVALCAARFSKRRLAS